MIEPAADHSTEDLARARVAAEKQYCRLGIPARYWDTTLQAKDLRWRSCSFAANRQGAKMTPTQQRSALLQVIAEPRRQLICIGSTPTDESGLAAASAVLCQAHDDGHNVAIVNAQYTRERLPQRLSIYVIHNILHDCTAERVEAVRDLLLRYRIARLIVVAGSKDPYGWCISRLRLTPTSVCCLVG